MVSSRSSIITVLSSDTVVTSAGVMSDSDIVRDGDAILSSTRESYNANDEDHRVNKVSGAIEWSQSDPPSLLSMSANLHDLVNSDFQDSKRYSIGKSEGTDAVVNNVVATNVPDITVAATTAVATISNSNGNCTSTSTIGNTSDLTTCTAKFSRNNDEEESYEGFGSVEDDGVDSPGGGSSSAPSPTGPNSLKNSKSPNSSIGRHSWLRTSLRRTPPCSGRKRLGSNALASQLYRSGSFNSSGRGSNCDPTDDMYSDVSLEDDVIDLNHRVQMIQEQMHALVDTQSAGEERYARAKQENATLQARILMLEEAAKDAEARSEERLQAEQRRHREWVCRLERERQLQLENYAIKLQAAELEGSSLRDEIGRLREQLERTKTEKARLERTLEESRREVEAARENERQAIGRANETHHMLRVAREELSMRIEDQQRLEDLVQQVAQLRARNKSLEESRDELQAAAALQAGRELLMLNPCNSNLDKGASLAVELLAGMNQDQMDGHTSADAQSAEPCTLLEMKQALREQQEVNTQLRAYIDGILLNIVENYPQLLEVKQTH